MMTLDGGRNGIAAQAVGIAQGALDAATNYAKERVQFGKPISAQQGVGFKLADMATSIEASRLLTYQAAWLESVGLPYGKESAMSKLLAGDTAMRVTTEAVQVFGGYGYTKDYPVERYLRDAKDYTNLRRNSRNSKTSNLPNANKLIDFVHLIFFEKTSPK